MRIESRMLDEIQAEYTGHWFVTDVIKALREAQEVIEKFKVQRWNGRCVYCTMSLHPWVDSYLEHTSDCPYAIRERLGYGQKEG